jgi:hypothetical protein
MAGPPPPGARGLTPIPRPQKRSQSRIPQPTSTPTPSQRDTSARRVQTPNASRESSTQAVESTTATPHLPQSTCRIIADGIHQIIEKFNPVGEPKLALLELLAFATKAAEMESSGQALLEKTAGLEDKLTKSLLQFEKSAERLETVAAEINGKLVTVSNTTSQLESTANTYKDALLKVPVQSAHVRDGQGDLDPAIVARADRKKRQVLIDFPDNVMSSFSEMAIIEKIKDAIKKVEHPPPPENAKIEEVTKLRKNGIMVLFSTKEMVDWIQDPDTELIFTGALASGSSIRQRQHLILVPKIPITLDPSADVHIREIEEVNRLKEHLISKIRWIKPERRRNPEQRLAHALFSLSSAEAANICIRDGLLVHGVKTYPTRLKQEPTQCLKCRKWGHFANQCTATKDTCGTCGGDHWTNACREATKRYCAPCGNNSHASWDRQCPVFLRRCAEYDETHPENALKYFPTEEPWTKVIRPAKLPFSERFPARFAVGSLPPPNRDLPREAPTRPINQRRRRCTPPRAAGQTSITNFYGPSGSQARVDDFTADVGEEGEVSNTDAASPLSFNEAHPFNTSSWN